MEQYQYVEGFQRFHTGLRLRCAACLSLQFLLFECIHYDIQHSFCIPNEKVATAPGPLTLKLISKQARLNATKSVLVLSLFTVTAVLSQNRLDFFYNTVFRLHCMVMLRYG